MFFVVLALLWLVLEIWTFAEVGGELGGGTVVLLVFASAALGVFAIARMALPHLSRMGQGANGDSGNALLQALCVVVAGVLLLIPGFVSDAAGLLLLLPPVQFFVRDMILDGFVGSHTFGLMDTEDLRDWRDQYKERKQKQKDASLHDPNFMHDDVQDADFKDVDDK